MEKSPYLIQHKDNPVHWMPWSEKAFVLAKKEDKPILLSVGYAACHWCHVMAHESFEDEGVASLMNEHFINIKVDREERPDIDAIYMSALQAMGVHGGWPMTIFMTPEKKAFWGGTYFSKEPLNGTPSFPNILVGISNAYKNDKTLIAEVKSNKVKKGATSDFMEIERQRGISVATSVLAFIYKNKKILVTGGTGLIGSCLLYTSDAADE